MKNLIIKSVLVLSIVIFSGFTLADSFVPMKKILGEWECAIPDAPYEYQNVVLVLTEVDGELNGEMRVGGQEMPMKDIVFKKSNLKASMNVQGEAVDFDLNFTKKTLEGSVTYSEGTLDITGTKK